MNGDHPCQQSWIPWHAAKIKNDGLYIIKQNIILFISTMDFMQYMHNKAKYIISLLKLQ